MNKSVPIIAAFIIAALFAGCTYIPEQETRYNLIDPIADYDGYYDGYYWYVHPRTRVIVYGSPYRIKKRYHLEQRDWYRLKRHKKKPRRQPHVERSYKKKRQKLDPAPLRPPRVERERMRVQPPRPLRTTRIERDAWHPRTRSHNVEAKRPRQRNEVRAHPPLPPAWHKKLPDRRRRHPIRERIIW